MVVVENRLHVHDEVGVVRRLNHDVAIDAGLRMEMPHADGVDLALLAEIDLHPLLARAQFDIAAFDAVFVAIRDAFEFANDGLAVTARHFFLERKVFQAFRDDDRGALFAGLAGRFQVRRAQFARRAGKQGARQFDLQDFLVRRNFNLLLGILFFLRKCANRAQRHQESGQFFHVWFLLLVASGWFQVCLFG